MKSVTVAVKDLQIFIKDRGQVVMLFLLPIVFVVAFSAIFGLSGEGDKSITLHAANQDRSGAVAAELIDRLAANEGLTLEFVSEDAGRSALESGEIERLLIIPERFSIDADGGQPTTLRIVSRSGEGNEATEAVVLMVDGIAKDLSLQFQLISALEQMGDMMGVSPEGGQAFTADVITRQAASQFQRSKSEPLISVESVLPTRILDERQRFSAVDLSVPGLAVLFVFLTATSTAVALFRENKDGTFRRLLVSPMSKVEMLVGKLLPNIAKTLLQVLVVFTVGRYVLPVLGIGALSGGNPAALIVIALLIAICSSTLGLLIGAIAKTENQISTLGTVILWVMGAVSGAFIPQFFLGGFLGSVGKVVPHYWAIAAFQDVLVRGEGLAGIGVELAVLGAFTVGFGAIGIWRFRFGDEV